jgi:hypothetical protein
MEQEGKEHIEEIKSNFIEDGIVYSFKGTFNFFNFEMHFNNIRYFNRSNVCINFSEILVHDLDFMAEYNSLIDLLDETGYEVYITGIPRLMVMEEVVLKKVRWLMHKNESGRVLFTD